MKTQLKKATTPRDMRRFIDLPHALYKGHPCYVPELYIAQKKLFNREQNPFFRHAEVNFILAERSGRIAGRIALIRNNEYIRATGKQHGFFGFFDVGDDQAVASELLNEAIRWGRKSGFTSLIGPVNLSTNDTCGLLVNGHDLPPVIQMTWQPSYCERFIEEAGFRKKMDLLAYRILPGHTDEKILRLRPRLEARLNEHGIRIRKFNMKDFSSEVRRIREVYNAAWEKNWGFVPMTKEEFEFAAGDMKPIVDTDFIYVAEHEGKAIGFALTVPNLNEVLIRMRRGRLFPSGIFKFLYYKSRVRSVRVLTLGVVEGYRKTGIDACFYARSIETARRKSIAWAEASWILENNDMMNRALRQIGGEVYKRYRIYDMDISS